MSRTMWLILLALSPVALLVGVGILETSDVNPQYKKRHPPVLAQILRGETNAALERLAEIERAAPEDPETEYMRALAYAARDDGRRAAAAMERALELGVPPERFVDSTTRRFEALIRQPEHDRLRARLRHRPVHGPMVGALRPRGADVWVRTVEPARVHVVVGRSASLSNARRSRAVRTDASKDTTAVIPVRGLRPDTSYHYGVVVEGDPDGMPDRVHRFRTAPARGRAARLRVAFGGGAGFVPSNERMWDTIGSFDPSAMLLLGDNVYIDAPRSPARQRYAYHRRHAVPEMRRLVASTAVYAIWDDHDFATDDSAGGAGVDTPPWKRSVWNVFRDNWVNPYYGGGREHPGCWHDFYLGDVHFIMLDGRYYRTADTMLGPRQKSWLLDTLEGSRGTFKVLVSPVPWTFHAKGLSDDTWNGFREERREIFGFLSEHGIDGVVLLSADRHRSDLWAIGRDDGYTLYEMGSSRLTNEVSHRAMPLAELSYDGSPSFGLLDFDTTLADPMVTYRVVTIDGEVVHSRTFQKGVLSHAK